jgi:hypothetical protein
MNGLLTEAENDIRERFYDNGDDNGNEQNIDTTMVYVVVMLTLLWTPPSPSPSRNNSNNAIDVKGHAYSTMKPVRQKIKNDGTYNRNPNLPVNVMVGYLPSSSKGNDDATAQRQSQNQLPNRYEHVPQAKSSSWCRRRRPLEGIFKNNVIDDDDTISDVILTKIVHSDGDENGVSIELLEGLTSNLFVVYEDNTIRTPATSDVLGGYVRRLIVTECAATRSGCTIEIGPIYTNDAPLWKEVFLTSSIRLVIPVQRILIPTVKVRNDGSTSIIRPDILWESPPCDPFHSTTTTTTCDALYEYLVSEQFGV